MRRRRLTEDEALAMPEIDRVREAIARSGGTLVCRATVFSRGSKRKGPGGTGLTCRLVVTVRGRAVGGRAVVLGTLLRMFPPNYRHKFTTVDRRRGTRGPQEHLQWYGRRMLALLEAIGWRTGSPKLDESLLKYRRWREYRRAAWAWGGLERSFEGAGRWVRT